MTGGHADRKACRCQKGRLYAAGIPEKKMFGKPLDLSKFVTVKKCLQAAPLHSLTPANKIKKELIR